ncbi:TIGR03960 family B12-binding radical SAM protein, partial [Candidatus Omnitrophota bacterium]
MLDILKPGRYINREWNAVHKEWDPRSLKVALSFPDIYEIGMSHLGLKILYGILNREKDVVCERVFAPWSDMEKRMRGKKEILSSIESRKGLRSFDVIGFSLQNEMSYVDVLNMLDLGGVPVLASERKDSDPLVIAGGPCAFNPEPMAPFIDAFVIGEAEEAVLEIARVIRGSRLEARDSRDVTLRELSKIDGVYVPALNVEPGDLKIHRRIVNDLESSFFPTDIVVPYIQIVHDRISIEIMRGCPHRCRFCQACKIFYPLRIRSVKRILEIAEESIKNTGYEEISLLSLSTGDYPYLEELVKKLEERFKVQGIKISLPSLRASTFKDNGKGQILKKRGITFAPEAGSDRLRAYLNKEMTNEEIIKNSNSLLKGGFKKVKLYFMMGLPGEKYEDLDAIIRLASQIKSVNLSISPFIAKPHSEFEKEKMDDLKTLEDKKAYLRSALNAQPSRRNIKIDFHDLKMSRVEAILA